MSTEDSKLFSCWSINMEAGKRERLGWERQGPTDQAHQGNSAEPCNEQGDMPGACKGFALAYILQIVEMYFFLNATSVSGWKAT